MDLAIVETAVKHEGGNDTYCWCQLNHPWKRNWGN